MVDYSTDEIARFVAIGKDKTLPTKKRGDALEDLVCYMLGQCSGVKLRRNSIDRSRSMEIDIAVAHRQDGWMSSFPTPFLVECKNWDAPVDSSAVSEFATKLRRRNVAAGLLIAANGITGDPNLQTSAHQHVSGAQQDGQRIIMLTLEQVTSVASTDEFIDLLTFSQQD